MWKNHSSSSGISGFIQMPDVYSDCVISNLFSLNPTLYLKYKYKYKSYFIFEISSFKM